jgi:hypothetical protein
MIAVDEVDIGVAGRAEENGVARGLAAVGVRSGIDRSEIGFGLDDASGDYLRPPTSANCGQIWGTEPRCLPTFANCGQIWGTELFRLPTSANYGQIWGTIEQVQGTEFSDQQLAEQLAGDLARIAVEERSRER